MSNIEASDKEPFEIKNMKNGVMLGPTKNPGVAGAPKCHQMQTSSQWRHMYNNGKQFENQLFIYEPKCKNYVYFGLFGGPEGVFNNQTGPILLSSYPLIHIYVHVK